MSAGPYTTRALEESTWEPFATLVERNNGVFGGCWCVAFHPKEPDSVTPQLRRESKLRRVCSGTAHAALVFDGDDCVGWCQFGSPEELPRIKSRDVQQIIPLPEAAGYRIEQEHTSSGNPPAAAPAIGRDLTKYMLVVDDTPSPVLNRRQAVRTAVQELINRGVPFDEVREAVGPGRWRPVRHTDGADLRTAFVQQHPDLQRPGRW